MKYLVKIVQKAGNGGMVFGAIFLAVALLVMVATIIYRLFRGVIPGSYEMVGLFVGINVTFALPFTALSKRHVTVNIFLSRFPERLQNILGSITSLIELAFWAVVAWATLGVILDRWTNEATLDIQLPMLPFRSIWFIGLIIFCLVLFLDVVDALRKGLKK